MTSPSSCHHVSTPSKSGATVIFCACSRISMFRIQACTRFCRILRKPNFGKHQLRKPCSKTTVLRIACNRHFRASHRGGMQKMRLSADVLQLELSRAMILKNASASLAPVGTCDTIRMMLSGMPRVFWVFGGGSSPTQRKGRRDAV